MVRRRAREVLGVHLGVFRRKSDQAVLKGTLAKEDARCTVVRRCGAELRGKRSSREGPQWARNHLRWRGQRKKSRCELAGTQDQDLLRGGVVDRYGGEKGG